MWVCVWVCVGVCVGVCGCVGVWVCVGVCVCGEEGGLGGGVGGFSSFCFRCLRRFRCLSSLVLFLGRLLWNGERDSVAVFVRPVPLRDVSRPLIQGILESVDACSLSNSGFCFSFCHVHWHGESMSRLRSWTL